MKNSEKVGTRYMAIFIRRIKRIQTYIGNVMLRHVMIFYMSLVCLFSCDTQGHGAAVENPLSSVEIYYQPRAPWGQLRSKTYGADALLSKGKPDLLVEDEQTLAVFSAMCAGFQPDTLSREEYRDAVIVAILRYSDRVDTLATNARPTFRMNLNSRPLYDKDMAMCLIRTVVDHDSGWKEAYDSLYYDNDFHYLSRGGFSQDLPHGRGGKWFYHENDPGTEE